MLRKHASTWKKKQKSYYNVEKENWAFTKFTMTPLKFFALNALLEIHVFSSIFGVPPGIQTTFTGIFHCYPQQGGLQIFSWKNKSSIFFTLYF